MNENKITTYLLYALGEIVLVVVGILIAVSIDDWNQARQKDKLEKSYLEEIKRSLEIDIKSVDEVLAYNDRKLKHLDTILQKMQNREYLEMIYSLMPHLQPTFDFNLLVLKRIAFDNMVSAESMALVANPSLRESLSEYYLFDNSTQERVKLVSRRFIDTLAPKLIIKEFTTQFLGYDIPIPTADNSPKLNEDPIVIESLSTLMMVTRAQNDMMANKKLEALELIAMIENEITTR